MTISGQMYDRFDPHLGLKEMDTDEVLSQLHAKWNYMATPTIVVFSGGEPMMQQAELIPVMRALREWNNETHIETAGTIMPSHEFDYRVTQYNVSPKLAHSGNRLEIRYKAPTLRRLRETGKAWFKFVVQPDTLQDDLREIENIVTECQIPHNRVMVMPEGSTAQGNISSAQKIIDEALSRGYGLSMRTHVLIWGDDVDK
jgi:organic radical activating enzyme